eukprot:3645079-Ditylum_brightwellii.AAC.1
MIAFRKKTSLVRFQDEYYNYKGVVGNDTGGTSKNPESRMWEWEQRADRNSKYGDQQSVVREKGNIVWCNMHTAIALIQLRRKENKSECKTQFEIMCEHKLLERLAQLEAELAEKDKMLRETNDQNQRQMELLNALHEDKRNQCKDMFCFNCLNNFNPTEV